MSGNSLDLVSFATFSKPADRVILKITESMKQAIGEKGIKWIAINKSGCVVGGSSDINESPSTVYANIVSIFGVKNAGN